MNKQKSKNAEFSFVWLFAIIVGTAILFFAIYGAMRATDTQKQVSNSKTAREISIITDPLQAGFAQGSFGSIEFNQETKIKNECFPDEDKFGKNELSVTEKSTVGKEWGIPGIPAQIYTKYIFSETESVAKKYYVFSRQFKLPYKVADLIFMTTKNYCFINAPEEVKEEIGGMNIPNIQVENCNLENKINVCFGTAGTTCDIRVTGCNTNCDEGSVIKKDSTLKYVGSLMYAAIFSDQKVYDCNVKRLLYRTSKIAEILSEKTNIMDSRDCESNLGLDLIAYAMETRSNKPLSSLNSMAKELENRNNKEVCGVWN